MMPHTTEFKEAVDSNRNMVALSLVTHLCLQHVYSLHFGLKLLIPSVDFMRSHKVCSGLELKTQTSLPSAVKHEGLSYLTSNCGRVK